MKYKKTVIVVAGLLVGVAGLWIAGPPPMVTGPYVQAVTSGSATLSKVGAVPRRLTARVWPAGQAGRERPIVVTEEQPGTVHAIRVDGLQPGSGYEYTLDDGGEQVAAGAFRTAPVDDAVPVRFTALGDSGELPWWYNMHRIGWSRMRPALTLTRTTQQWHIVEWMAAQDPHFFLHVGDIVYWRQLRDAHEEAYFRPFEPLLRDTPIYTLIGNHDIPRGGGTPPFEEFFRNPSPPGVGRPHRNFTVAWGSVRLVGFDVVDGAWETGPARAWLERTLAEATEPWLVVATHIPCFSAYAVRTENPALRDRLWPLLARYGVDLLVCGDDHHFVRFKPTAPDSPTQITVGGGGKSLYDIKPDPRVANSAKAWSYLLVEARGLRLTARVLGAPGVEYDEFVVDRSKGPLAANLRPARRARIERLRK